MNTSVCCRRVRSTRNRHRHRTSINININVNIIISQLAAAEGGRGAGRGEATVAMAAVEVAEAVGTQGNSAILAKSSIRTALPDQVNVVALAATTGLAAGWPPAVESSGPIQWTGGGHLGTIALARTARHRPATRRDTPPPLTALRDTLEVDEGEGSHLQHSPT